jgi:hypothetical protein
MKRLLLSSTSQYWFPNRRRTVLNKPLIAAGLLCALLVHRVAGAEKSAAKTEAFDSASARFEQNATDGDVEAVFEAIASDDGLTKLAITAPDGRTIIDFSAPGRSATGMRQFRFESPEPTDVPGLKKAFPEGEYTFVGSTSSGTQFKDKATLKHKLPPTTSFVFPKAEARNVPAHGLKISWKPVKGVIGYTVELDPSKSSAHLEMKLPETVTSFTVPDGILANGGKCQLGIGTVSRDGNVSVIETTFSVAGK